MPVNITKGSVKQGVTKTQHKSQVTLIAAKKNDFTALVTNGTDSVPDDNFSGSYMAQGGGTNFISILEPTYKPLVLKQLSTTNNILSQCVEAMEVNIDGTGHSIELVEGATENEKEKQLLVDFFAEPYPQKSMISIRRDLRRDLEETGNGYLEIIRSMAGDIVMLNILQSETMRLIRLDDPVVVTKTITRNGADEEVKIRARERRFVQIINGQRIFFKEFGSSRELNRITGEWADPTMKLSVAVRSSELMHFTVNKEPRTPYGAPRWINQLPSVLGSRKAEEFNLEFFDAGGLPPVLVLVQGGYLGTGVKESLESHLGGQGAKHRAAIVEAIAASGSLDSSGQVKVTVERFGTERQQDAMFSAYDKNCEEHVRVAFRLPPLFIGRAQDYNFACYSDDTETLTDRGWIKWDEFEPGMRIATVNPQTLSLEYHKPFGNKAMVYDVKDVQMHHIKKSNVDLLVTPKHRMMYSTDDGPRRVAPIEDMLSLVRVRLTNHISSFKQGVLLEQFVIPVAMTGTYNQDTLGGQSIQGNLFLEFLGYWISEGTSSDAYSQRGVVTVGQKKPAQLIKIKKCFADLRASGLKVYESSQANAMEYLSIKNFGLKEWLASACGGKAFEKRLPPMFRALPQSQLQILFDALMLGDGTVDSRIGRKSGAYSTTSKGLADDVQELALMLGLRASVRQDRAGTYGIRPTYRVMLTWGAPDNQVDTTRDVAIKPYTGKVYCFSVPNGVFITRRNGLVAIQGNTALTGYMVAEAQVFGPERIEFDTGMMAITRALGVKSYRFKSKPMTLSNIDNQLKAITTALGTQAPTIVDGESVITALNKLTGLELKYEKPPEPTDPIALAQAQAAARTGVQPPTGTPTPAGPQKTSQKPIKATPGPSQKPAPGADKTKVDNQSVQRTVTKEDSLSYPSADYPVDHGAPTVELVWLAEKWSNVLGLVSPCDLDEGEIEVVKHEVSSLRGEDALAFNTIMASKSLVSVDKSSEGLAALCGCAGDLMVN